MQTFTGREYLKIDIANNFSSDLDKANWDQRIAWFDHNEHQLESLVPDAKEPALFYAGVKAWRDVQMGKPIGYMISLDATSSGIQLLAALTGDPFAAQLCNVVNTGRREDAYNNIYTYMLNIVQDTAKIDRDDTKQAIMTSFYSSKAVPKRVFGEGNLLDVFYGSLQELAPAAWELNEAMLRFWNPNAYEHCWVLPDNFHVRIKVMNQIKETVHFCNEPFDVYYKINAPIPEGRSLGANMVHSIDGMIVRELTRRCDYSPHKIQAVRRIIDEQPTSWGMRAQTKDDQMVIKLWDHYCTSGFLSARILDHLRMENAGFVNVEAIRELIDSMPEKPFKVVSIHDCFRVLPHYGNDLRRQYALQLQLIAKSNLLQSIISQLLGKSVQIDKLDPNLWQHIGHTNYALS